MKKFLVSLCYLPFTISPAFDYFYSSIPHLVFNADKLYRLSIRAPLYEDNSAPSLKFASPIPNSIFFNYSQL